MKMSEDRKNKILYYLVSDLSIDDLLELLSYIDNELAKRGYDLDVRCS